MKLFAYTVVAFVLRFGCMNVAEGLESDRMFRHTHPRLGASTAPGNKNEKSSQYYLDAGKSFVEQQSKKQINRNVAKNMILYLGDGMSAPTLSAARMYMGGEERSLSFEKFPFVGMSKTYCVNKQVADSACSATGQQNSIKCLYFFMNDEFFYSKCFQPIWAASRAMLELLA